MMKGGRRMALPTQQDRHRAFVEALRLKIPCPVHPCITQSCGRNMEMTKTKKSTE